MDRSELRVTAVAAALAFALLGSPASSQQISSAAGAEQAESSNDQQHVNAFGAFDRPDADWEHPRTPWGAPDLQGMWPIGHLTGVPLQRPEGMGERRLLTDEELQRRREEYAARQEAYESEVEQNQLGRGHWTEWGELNRLTSLIVDPEDGRLPELTEEGQRRSSQMRSSWMDIPFDHWTDFDSWDRCITRSLPASMLPAYYNNGIEIVQAPGYVVIRLEMIHETRIIPIGAQEPIDAGTKAWLGYSRGRWQGNTLVVETTNFNGKGSSTNIHTVGAPPFNNTPLSEQYVLTERFTRTGPNTMIYQFTVHDPVIWSEPWTVEMPWVRDESYEIYEYACHEGNTIVRNYIETSRAERARQASADSAVTGR